MPGGWDREGGFTLVEILVVIAVLAVLAAVVVLRLDHGTDEAARSACATERDVVVTAVRAANLAVQNGETADTPADHLDGATRYFAWSGAPGVWTVNAAGPIPFGC
jgi:prepilin-type N-terminal cleavage/methylation domain-containing protein